jgi:hypothetical protein
LVSSARAQENYEIQVYGYDTVEPGHTMVELHGNFTFEGSKTSVTASRTGSKPASTFFAFEHKAQGVDRVGDHIRPRFRAATTPAFSVHRPELSAKRESLA